MIKKFLTFCNHNHWYIIAFFLYAALILWGLGCQPKCESLIHEGEKITVPQLQAEIDFLTQSAEARIIDIEEQKRVKQELLTLAAILGQQGGVQYTGIFSALAAVGGVAFGLDRNYKLKRANKKTTSE